MTLALAWLVVSWLGGVFIADGEIYYTALEDRIHPYQEGTGYWRHSDPQHPKHTVPQNLPTPGPSTATVDISASGDPPRTPSIFPSPIFASAQTQATQTAKKHQITSSAETQVDPAQVELPLSRIATPQEQLEENILVAQLENVLALEDRELENPLTPDQPVPYLQLMEDTVTRGVNLPPPPPAIQQPVLNKKHQYHYQWLIKCNSKLRNKRSNPQPPPATLTGRLRGETPDVFT